MKHFLFAVLATATTMAVFATPSAMAQGDCEIVCIWYKDSVYSGGACRGRGIYCFMCYRVCDGQPYPIDYRAAPGHLVTPQSQVANADRVNLPSNTQPQFGMETRIAEAPKSCQSQSLFNRLDPRQKPNLLKVTEEPMTVPSAGVAAPAVP